MDDVQAIENTPTPARIEFSGSGSEYFRIWIVNMVLIVFTAGIYSAWAKVRREKYFHQHTKINGMGLEYHGKPIPILFGRIIILGLFYLSQFPTVPGAVLALAVGAFVLALPFLMQRSLRFRLFNTSHRGIRFGFDGTARDAYKLALPVLMAYAASAAAGYWLSNHGPALASSSVSSVIVVIVALSLATAAVYLYSLGVWKVFALSRARFGLVKSVPQFTAMQFLKAILGKIVKLLFMLATTLALMYALFRIFGGGTFGQGLNVLAIVFSFAFVITFYASLLAATAYIAASMHRFVWNENVRLKSSFEVAHFNTDLSTSAFCWLQIKNTVLVFLTLGLYRPFAAVASAKMRLESVTLSDTRFIEAVTTGAGQQKGALGDEAVEALDWDFSL